MTRLRARCTIGSAPSPAAIDDVEGAHAAVVADGPHVDDLRAVLDEVRHLPRRPLEVVVKLDPQRKQRLVVHEVHEAPAGVQVGDEAVGARRVAHRDEVLEERDLHRRVVEQHAAVPAEAFLLLDEQRVERRLGRVRGVVLVDRERERERGGLPEVELGGARAVAAGLREQLRPAPEGRSRRVELRRRAAAAAASRDCRPCLREVGHEDAQRDAVHDAVVHEHEHAAGVLRPAVEPDDLHHAARVGIQPAAAIAVCSAMAVRSKPSGAATTETRSAASTWPGGGTSSAQPASRRRRARSRSWWSSSAWTACSSPVRSRSSGACSSRDW